MLRYGVIHPEILGALAAAGHGSTVLIADGHYPVSTGTARDARTVWLNLRPGLLTATHVLEALVDVVAIETATVMQPPADQAEPEAFDDFQALVAPLPLSRLERFAFYAAARQPDLALTIATGDVRTYANLLLTVGVAIPSQPSQPSPPADGRSSRPGV
jgi:L-fucose mutarotase